jgi:hypothetical protein
MRIRLIGNFLIGALMGFIFARVLGSFSIEWWVSIIVFTISINMVTWEGE